MPETNTPANTKSKKPVAKYEPGELERTRRNLGQLAPEEALKMMHTLGGEIGIEKSVPIDEKKLPKRTKVYIPSQQNQKPQDNTPEIDIVQTQQSNVTVTKKHERLQELPSKIRNSMDEILVVYSIKPKLSFFASLLNKAFYINNKLTASFITDTLLEYLNHTKKFITAMTNLINECVPKYRQEIDKAETMHYKALNVIYHWSFTELLSHYKKLTFHPADVTIQQIIPFIRCYYQFLYKLFFLGENLLTQIIKNTYIACRKESTVNADILQSYSMEATSEWMYIYSQVIKGLYPLLMRMCSSDLEPYPEFFTFESSNILRFLQITKYDVVLPEKKAQENDTQKKSTQPKNKEEVSTPEDDDTTEQISDKGLISRGLRVLDTLFPEAGWNKLYQHPDMYAYFHAVYQLPESYVYIPQDNPLLVTYVLLRIIEDLLQGCRNITFKLDETITQALGPVPIQTAIDEWSYYRERLFEKNYLDKLKDYVTHVYTNKEYTYSQFGRKEVANIMWTAKNLFLPHLSFDLKFMTKPISDNPFEPVFNRISQLKYVFSMIIKNATTEWANSPEQAITSTTIGAFKLWDPFEFQMGNPISKRITVLLGGKNSKEANNLNLLKYTLCIMSVLDWWLNDETSPAYIDNGKCPFRRDNSGNPVFSIEPISDVNSLFTNHLKKEPTTNI